MFKYFPHTDADIKHMLDVIGVKTLEELFHDVPDELLIKETLMLDESKSEIEIRNLLQSLAKRNKEQIIFAGGGAYDHYIPSVIPALVSRQEFLTSYTPYQPEIAQGTLTYIFEFQSYMTSLTGLDVSNASMYDGATATAEACIMAVNHKRTNRILLADTIHPSIIETVQTYAKYRGFTVELVKSVNGLINENDLKSLTKTPFAAFVTQSPNYFGIVEDMQPFSDLVHADGGLFIMNVDPASLALLKSPGEYGADIACGDAQTLGLPLNFGGPHLGFLCAKEELLRRMPGRICGMSKDVNGKRAFVLTLQAREQHIRREKANSNICSNQSLMALWVTIYMSLLGAEGLKRVQNDSMKNARYLRSELLKTGLFTAPFSAPYFYEFALVYKKDAVALTKKLESAGFMGPLLTTYQDKTLLLFAATEKRSKSEIDAFTEIVRNA